LHEINPEMVAGGAYFMFAMLIYKVIFYQFN